jgi:aldehyde dehydrogenase (NAD+)
MPTLQEVRVTYNNVAKWAKTEYAPPSLVYGAMRPAVRKDPKGVVLIISPFNFPVSDCVHLIKRSPG